MMAMEMVSQTLLNSLLTELIQIDKIRQHGILDAKEIEIGSDPKSSDRAVFNLGKSSVTSDPASYSG